MCKSCLQTGHLQSTCPMGRPTKKRRPKTRTKRWDNPDPNYKFETEEEGDGIIQNAENKETEAEMNMDMKEVPGGRRRCSA